MTASEWQEPTTNPPRSRAWGSEHAWEPALEPGLGEMALADGPGASAPQQRQRQTPGPRQHASQPVPGCRERSQGWALWLGRPWTRREVLDPWGGGWGLGSALLSRIPTSPWLAYPTQGLTLSQRSPAARRSRGKVRGRGGGAPAPLEEGQAVLSCPGQSCADTKGENLFL